MNKAPAYQSDTLKISPRLVILMKWTTIDSYPFFAELLAFPFTNHQLFKN